MPGLEIRDALLLSPKQLQAAFNKYARYFQDSPRPYAIRVAGATLFSADTHDLRKAFGRRIGELKRQRKAQRKRKARRGETDAA